MAGISFLRARSPVTPKSTIEQGPAMRGSRLSRGSRSGLLPAVTRDGLIGGPAPAPPGPAASPASWSVRCRRRTGRPWSARTLASPAAWAEMNSPKVKSRPGTSRSSAGAAVTCTYRPVARTALVVLPGGVEEPRAPPEGGRATGAVEQVAGHVLEVGVGLAVQVGHDGDVAALGVETGEEGLDGGLERVGVAEPVAAGRADLDGPVGEGGLVAGADAGLQQVAGGGLGALDVGLVEGVDAEERAGDGGGGLPEEELRPERPGHGDLGGLVGGRGAGVDVVVRGDEPHHGAVVVGVRGLVTDGDDGQQPGALLAGGLGDELLGPGGEADVLGAGVHEHGLVAQRLGAREGGPQAQGGVGVVVGGEQVGDRLGVVEEGLDVRAGEAARHQPEGGERRVAAPDRGVGVHHPEALAAGLGVERAARVGDDDHPGRGVQPGVAERLLEGASLAVGLDRGAGLARHDDDGAVQVGEGGPHDVGVGGVEHDERDAGRGADHLGGQRRPAHAAEDDAVVADLPELVPQGGDLTDERPGGAGQAGPGQPLRGLVLGRRSPQGLVLREEPAREALLDQPGDVGGDGVGRGPRGRDVEGAHAEAFWSSRETPSSSSSHDFANFSTPSRSSWATTSA